MHYCLLIYERHFRELPEDAEIVCRLRSILPVENPGLNLSSRKRARLGRDEPENLRPIDEILIESRNHLYSQYSLVEHNRSILF